MSKENRDEKIQVLLSSSDYQSLKNSIIKHAMESGQLMTTSGYVREIILNHIRGTEGDVEQKSFANDKVKEIIRTTKF
jgi:DNA-directed RNA polymerase beta' subunit